MELGAKTVFAIKLGNYNFAITETVVLQWIIMAIITILAILLTKNMKKVPDKKQSVVEMVVNLINGLVKENMGEEYMNFVPIIGTMAVFILFLNLTGLVGIEPATKDISVTAGFALVSAFLINATALKRIGIGGYIKAIFSQGPIMAPMNVLEKVTIPVSLCLRLFINMLVGAIVMSLIYQTPARLIVPVPLHGFFDLFDGVLQVYVFILLTMIFTKLGIEH
jgi:F-type H+-transporting ATPase subunit a